MWYLLGINILLACSAYVALSAGMLPLCLGTFMAIGGIAGTWLYSTAHFPALVGMLAGAIAGALSAVGISVVCVRLRGFQFALATIAIAQLAEGLAEASDRLGGATGFVGGDANFVRVALLPVLIVCISMLVMFERSSFRHALFVLSANESLACELGVSPAIHRGIALGVAGAIAGAAGVFYLSLNGLLEPGTFGMYEGISILTFPILGGSATFLGSIAGASILTLVPEILRLSTTFDLIRTGVSLVFVTIVLPDGLLGRSRFWFSKTNPIGPRSRQET